MSCFGDLPFVRCGGVCGLPLCCASFIREFEPISTHLAREQNLSLNPAKISGNCGRLLCCLRYEKKLYEKSLPLYPKLMVADLDELVLPQIGEKFLPGDGQNVSGEGAHRVLTYQDKILKNTFLA